MEEADLYEILFTFIAYSELQIERTLADIDLRLQRLEENRKS